MTIPLGGLGLGGIFVDNEPLRGEDGGEGPDWSRGEDGAAVLGCPDWEFGAGGTGGGVRGEDMVRMTGFDGADLLMLI